MCAFSAYNPATNAALSGDFSAAGAVEAERAAKLAAQAFPSYATTDLETRARFLDTAADAIAWRLADDLIKRAMAETGLSRTPRRRARAAPSGSSSSSRASCARAISSTPRSIPHCRTAARAAPRSAAREPAHRPGRGVRGLEFSARLLSRRGRHGLLWRPDARSSSRATSARPGTGELVARAIQSAVKAWGLHEGVFSYLPGNDRALGSALVADPRVKAVGFTGSRGGGTALLKIAAARPRTHPGLCRDVEHQSGHPDAARARRSRRGAGRGLRRLADDGRRAVLYQPWPRHCGRRV